MRKFIIILGLVNVFISSFGQKKDDILKEIYAYRKSIVSVATYDKKASEIWSAIYIITTEEYNTISRESESKGYIEGKLETNTYKETCLIEIKGDAQPYRVSFLVNQETRTKYENGTYSGWVAYRSPTLNTYITRLQLRLYELLNGTLELSTELQNKIDNYNSLQKKDKKKIIKGKDY